MKLVFLSILFLCYYSLFKNHTHTNNTLVVVESVQGQWFSFFLWFVFPHVSVEFYLSNRWMLCSKLAVNWDNLSLLLFLTAEQCSCWEHKNKTNTHVTIAQDRNSMNSLLSTKLYNVILDLPIRWNTMERWSCWIQKRMVYYEDPHSVDWLPLSTQLENANIYQEDLR